MIRNLEFTMPTPEDSTREQVLAALRTHHAEHRCPALIKTLGRMTHRRTQTVMDAVQELVAARLAQRI